MFLKNQQQKLLSKSEQIILLFIFQYYGQKL
jgi:hypothetical protein